VRSCYPTLLLILAGVLHPTLSYPTLREPDSCSYIEYTTLHLYLLTPLDDHLRDRAAPRVLKHRAPLLDQRHLILLSPLLERIAAHGDCLPIVWQLSRNMTRIRNSFTVRATAARADSPETRPVQHSICHLLVSPSCSTIIEISRPLTQQQHRIFHAALPSSSWTVRRKTPP
jgi:hypothetical protein